MDIKELLLAPIVEVNEILIRSGVELSNVMSNRITLYNIYVENNYIIGNKIVDLTEILKLYLSLEDKAVSNCVYDLYLVYKKQRPGFLFEPYNRTKLTVEQIINLTQELADYLGLVINTTVGKLILYTLPEYPTVRRSDIELAIVLDFYAVGHDYIKAVEKYGVNISCNGYDILAFFSEKAKTDEYMLRQYLLDRVYNYKNVLQDLGDVVIVGNIEIPGKPPVKIFSVMDSNF